MKADWSAALSVFTIRFQPNYLLHFACQGAPVSFWAAMRLQLTGLGFAQSCDQAVMGPGDVLCREYVCMLHASMYVHTM